MTEKLRKLFAKYEKLEPITGPTYQSLISKVIAHNSEKIYKAVNRIEKTKWDNAFKKAKRSFKEGRQFIIPEMTDVLPKKSVFLRKSADSGQSITKTLYDRLTSNLRDTLESSRMTTIRGGKKVGLINPKHISDFQEKIAETFLEYTRKDSRYGVPKNIRAIAITEVRSAVNDSKNQYVSKLIEKNHGLEFDKQWVHNRGLQKVPRRGHLELDGKSLPFNQMFAVKTYTSKEINGKIVYKYERTEMMKHPHDPNGSAENVIFCSCDVKYNVREVK